MISPLPMIWASNSETLTRKSPTCSLHTTSIAKGRSEGSWRLGECSPLPLTCRAPPHPHPSHPHTRKPPTNHTSAGRCGPARHSLNLSKAAGTMCFALDSSSAMLSYARGIAEGAGPAVAARMKFVEVSSRSKGVRCAVLCSPRLKVCWSAESCFRHALVTPPPSLGYAMLCYGCATTHA